MRGGVPGQAVVEEAAARKYPGWQETKAPSNAAVSAALYSRAPPEYAASSRPGVGDASTQMVSKGVRAASAVMLSAGCGSVGADAKDVLVFPSSASCGRAHSPRSKEDRAGVCRAAGPR